MFSAIAGTILLWATLMPKSFGRWLAQIYQAFKEYKP